MENKLGLIGKVLMYLLMAAGVTVTIVILLNSTILADQPLVPLDSHQLLVKQQILNFTMIVAAVALIITAFLSVVFPLGNMILNPKSLIRFAIVLVALGLVYLASYSLADGNIEKYMLEPEYSTSEAGSKYVGSMMYLIYIIGGLAVLTTVGSGILNLFKR